MKFLITLLLFVILSASCSRKISQQDCKLTDKESQILAVDCDYVFDKCKNISVVSENQNLKIYAFNEKLINLLRHTNCFIGLSSNEVISILGNPTVFRPSSSIHHFMIYDFYINGTDDYYQAKYYYSNDTIRSGKVRKITIYRN